MSVQDILQKGNTSTQFSIFSLFSQKVSRKTKKSNKCSFIIFFFQTFRTSTGLLVENIGFRRKKVFPTKSKIFPPFLFFIFSTIMENLLEALKIAYSPSSNNVQKQAALNVSFSEISKKKNNFLFLFCFFFEMKMRFASLCAFLKEFFFLVL
jgi:hypothetical protein